MSDYIGAIEDYLAWRTSHDGESRDVSPTAYYEHLENLKNARIVSEIREVLDADEFDADNFIIEVSTIVNGEA